MVERQSFAIVVSGCVTRGRHVQCCVFVLFYADTCSVAGSGETCDRSGLVPAEGVTFAIFTQGQVRPVRGGESALHILGMGCKQEQQGNRQILHGVYVKRSLREECQPGYKVSKKNLVPLNQLQNRPIREIRGAFSSV